jgi:hypothetical protein
MKYSTDLYDLIQSLTQAEKRYIKLFAQAFSSKGTETQVALFDTFAKQAVCDEEQARKELSGKIAANNFHVAKNRLYNLILRGLYLFHSSQSEGEKINQLMFEAHILRKRGLYKQSQDLLERAMEQATETESLALIPQIQSGLGKLIMQKRDMDGIRNYINRDLQEEREAMARYEYELTFQYLEMKLFALTHTAPTARTEAQLAEACALRQHPMLQDEEKARSVSKRALWFYRFLNGFIYRYEGNHAKAAEYWSGFVTDIENDDKAIAARLTDFIGDLNNLMFLQLEAKQYDNAWATCGKLERLMTHENVMHDLYLSMKIRERVIEFRLAYFLRCHLYAEGLAYWQKEIESEWCADWAARVGNLRRLAIEFSAASLYLSAGKADVAEVWLSRAAENKALKSHDYLYSAVLLLQLIIHFELKNFQLLESLAMNTYRNLYKRKLLYGAERIVFKYLRVYLRSGTNKDMISSFKTMQVELNELQKEKFEHILLDNFSLTAWIQSIIDKKTMSDIANQLQKTQTA